MTNKKHLTVLATATVIFIIATIFSESTDKEISGAGDLLYPGLLEKANDVSEIKIQRNSGTLTLKNNNGMWQVAENNGYPADLNKVRELVLGVANLLRIEPKTKKAENYTRIGLQDITEDGSPAVHVQLGIGTETVADLIIGNNKTSHADSSKLSYYVRTASDPQSWLVDGKLPDKWEPKNWLEANIFEVDRARIKQVIVDHPDGEKVYIHRKDSSVRDFTLDSLKPGEEVTAPFEINNIATTFTKMTFDDVVSEKAAGVETVPAYTAKLATFDGLVVTFQPYKKDDKHLVKYSASYDESMVSSTVPVSDDAAENKPSSDKLKSAEQVKKEVEKYNGIWSGWMYQIPEFRITNIGKKKADFLKKDHGNKPIH